MQVVLPHNYFRSGFSNGPHVPFSAREHAYSRIRSGRYLGLERNPNPEELANALSQELDGA